MKPALRFRRYPGAGRRRGIYEPGDQDHMRISISFPRQDVDNTKMLFSEAQVPDMSEDELARALRDIRCISSRASRPLSEDAGSHTSVLADRQELLKDYQGFVRKVLS